MKQYADSHRHKVTFKEGDWVYVHLCPCQQNSLQPNYSKLSKCFYGLFQVQVWIGPVAYCLQLPMAARTHPVFYVCLLKPYHGPPPAAIFHRKSQTTTMWWSHYPFWIGNWTIQHHLLPKWCWCNGLDFLPRTLPRRTGKTSDHIQPWG